jgi:hypothetical protein
MKKTKSKSEKRVLQEFQEGDPLIVKTNSFLDLSKITKVTSGTLELENGLQLDHHLNILNSKNQYQILKYNENIYQELQALNKINYYMDILNTTIKKVNQTKAPRTLNRIINLINYLNK